MATDGPDPTPCNKEIFNEGEFICMTNSIPSNAMEGWVKKIAEVSGQPVDWHFAGGRARVLALGDIGKVKEAVIELKDEHDKLYMKAMKKFPFMEHQENWGCPDVVSQVS